MHHQRKQDGNRVVATHPFTVILTAVEIGQWYPDEVFVELIYLHCNAQQSSTLNMA
jgi:hypothetical protein